MAANRSLIFRGVTIRYLDMRRKSESAPFVRLHLTADLSDNVRATMGWSVGDNQSSGSFIGSINAVAAIFGPNQKKLPGMEVAEVNVECHEVGDFTFSEVKGKDGATKGMKLDFIIRSNEIDAEAKLGAYWRQIMGGDSQLKVTYSGIGKQQNLEATEEQGAAA